MNVCFYLIILFHVYIERDKFYNDIKISQAENLIRFVCFRLGGARKVLLRVRLNKMRLFICMALSQLNKNYYQILYYLSLTI